MSQLRQSLERVLIVFIAFVCLHRAVRCAVTVTPWEQSAQLGSDAMFFCRDDGNATNDMLLTWAFVPAKDNKISIPINSTGRMQAVNGTLTLRNLTYEDAGTYNCNNSVVSETAQGILIVYVMPDYLKEGLVIAGISVALLIIVVAGTCILIVGQMKVKKARLSEHEKRLLKRVGSSHK